MISHSETTVFTVHELFMFRRAKSLVDSIPEYLVMEQKTLDTSQDLRCHELARAVGKVLDLKVVDGIFGAVEHSWLEIKGKSGMDILDVYCVGCVPAVQLKHSYWGLPNNYRAGKERTDIDETVVHLLVNRLQHN